MSVKTVEWMEWTAPNRPGMLLKYATEFKKRKINLDAFGCGVSGGRGIIAASAKRPGQLKAALRAMKVKPRLSRSFYVSGKDKAGALVNVLNKLAKARINIDCAKAIAAQGKFGSLIWVKGSKFGQAKRLLHA